MVRVSTIMKILGYLIGAFAAVAAGLQAANVWKLTGKTLVVLVVGAAVVTLISQLAGLWGTRRKARRERLQQDVRDSLFTMFLNVLEDSKARPETLGFAAYEVRRRWIWQWPSYSKADGWSWRLPLPWREVLWRLDRHQAHDRHDASETVWRPGMGIIGLCVARGDLVRADVADTWADWADCSPEEWAQAPEDVRQGFTFAEFQARRSKARVVWALPIIREGSNGRSKVLGCVALDGAAGDLPRFDKNSAHTRRHLKDASSAIGNCLAR
ncbi:hypothetical protein [Blastococcus sp. TF02A-30]|uniref:hypothetical protein n=1 Tax=Blastococcus sp. TF02A-30 TaxID=2250580 RepID=UPI000DEA35C9|nr:hypothetical protein [Blastococcus sp. TF02A-30]RBY86380.1 hypothetical protein DQ241_12575 [Blastococcus sp. TF02A-30]